VGSQPALVGKALREDFEEEQTVRREVSAEGEAGHVMGLSLQTLSGACKWPNKLARLGKQRVEAAVAVFALGVGQPKFYPHATVCWLVAVQGPRCVLDSVREPAHWVDDRWPFVRHGVNPLR